MPFSRLGGGSKRNASNDETTKSPSKTVDFAKEATTSRGLRNLPGRRVSPEKLNRPAPSPKKKPVGDVHDEQPVTSPRGRNRLRSTSGREQEPIPKNDVPPAGSPEVTTRIRRRSRRFVETDEEASQSIQLPSHHTPSNQLPEPVIEGDILAEAAAIVHEDDIHPDTLSRRRLRRRNEMTEEATKQEIEDAVVEEGEEMEGEEMLDELEQEEILHEEIIHHEQMYKEFEELDGEMIDQKDFDESMFHQNDGNTYIESREQEQVDHDLEPPGEDGHEEEEDDDAPPQLEPEEGPNSEEILIAESMERGAGMMEYIDGNELIRVQSPGGTPYVVASEMDGEMYLDGDMMVDDPIQSSDPRTVEFNFLDNKNICCGLCGEIVPYDMLLSEHIPTQHADVFGEGHMDLEEIPYEQWLREKLVHEKKSMENGFRTTSYHADPSGRVTRSSRMLRRVSQVRVNPAGMTLAQLDVALKKKMIEKMGRKVKVSLVDKQHARCGECNAIVSLNKKFEVVHLVRHMNAWHPAHHRCAGSWPAKALNQGTKPLSVQDFAVVEVGIDAPDSLQCIWCGMFMDRNALAMHFHECHPDDVEVPKCHLCLQEMVINARLLEKFGEDFEVTHPNEQQLRCNKLGQTFNSEHALDRAIEKRIRKIQSGEVIDDDDEEEEEDEPNKDNLYNNSRMNFGRRNKPKRTFVMPALRQAIPNDSRYVESVADCQWRCKMCGKDIFAAVISAGAIRHYRERHPEQLADMQYELCKARLERVSDGCMEFVHPQLIECLICNLTYTLHKPYNMCRGIRHLKTKHPEMMPEYAGNVAQTNNRRRKDDGFGGVQLGECITNPETIQKFKSEFNVEFDKVQTVYGPDGEPIYVLVPDGTEIDQRIADNIQHSILGYDEHQNHDFLEPKREPTEEELEAEMDELVEVIEGEDEAMGDVIGEVLHEEVVSEEQEFQEEEEDLTDGLHFIDGEEEALDEQLGVLRQ